MLINNLRYVFMVKLQSFEELRKSTRDSNIIFDLKYKNFKYLASTINF